MPEYEYLLGAVTGGSVICELPFTPAGPYTRVLTGCGSFSGSIPLDDATATTANFGVIRNLIVLRNGLVDWWGPTSQVTPNLESRTLDINAREPTWWMSRRAIEVDKHYNADTHYIFRKLWTTITSKTSTAGDGTGSAGSNINAPLANITVSSGNSGHTKRLVLSGPARHLMADAIGPLIEDPDTGIEYRVDYSGATRAAISAQITVGSPLGATKTPLLTEHVLFHYGRGLDWERGGTRAHVVGSASSATRQNTASIAAGVPLLDIVADRSEWSDDTTLADAARELRRKAQPPVQVYDAEYTPHANGLTINMFDPGDTVPIKTKSPALLALSVSRRIVEVAVMPQTADAQESVGLMFNLPLDELGA